MNVASPDLRARHEGAAVDEEHDGHGSVVAAVRAPGRVDGEVEAVLAHTSLDVQPLVQHLAHQLVL